MPGFGLLFAGTTIPQSELDDRAAQFIDGDVGNAPTLFCSAPTERFGNNIHLCYRDIDLSFFARILALTGGTTRQIARFNGRRINCGLYGFIAVIGIIK